MRWFECIEQADNGGWGKQWQSIPGVFIRRKVADERNDPHAHVCPRCSHRFEHNYAEMFSCNGRDRDEMHTCPSCGQEGIFTRVDVYDGKIVEWIEEQE